MTKTFWKIVAGSFLVFFFSWLFAYKIGVNSLAIQSEDTVPALFLPIAIIQEKTLYLDTYYDMMTDEYPHPKDRGKIKGFIPFYVQKVGEHYVSAFPIMSSILAIPVYFLPLKLGMFVNIENLTYLGHVSGSLIMAFSGGFLYLLLRQRFSLDDAKSKLLTGVFLFGTVNFALISQALWQHGTLQLFLILALYYLLDKRWFLASLFLSFAFITRHSFVLLIPFLSLIFIEMAYKKSFEFVKDSAKFILGFIPPLWFFFWYTNRFYVSISNNSYIEQFFSGWGSKFPEGFLGLWLSPSKGILVYSPILVFALVGFWLAVKKGAWKNNFNFVIFGAVVLIHTLVLGIWKHWYGGWSFGYRMASDISPFLVILMIPYIKSSLFEVRKKLFYSLFGLSIGIEVFGIIFFDGIWHAVYDDGFINTKWLWSIKDSELVFNIRRTLVKFGLKAHAH